MWADGTKYEGGWKDDQRHGFGTLSFPEGNSLRVSYSGDWSYDKMDVLTLLSTLISRAQAHIMTYLEKLTVDNGRQG